MFYCMLHDKYNVSLIQLFTQMKGVFIYRERHTHMTRHTLTQDLPCMHLIKAAHNTMYLDMSKYIVSRL